MLSRMFGLQFAEETPQAGLARSIERSGSGFSTPAREDRIGFFASSRKQIAHDIKRLLALFNSLPTPDRLLPHLQSLKYLQGRFDNPKRSESACEFAL
jgi:hypothetical protein